ncbi:MAG: FumA C-terminus/TtdB family hydratase beta subunit [Erysipelotrichaceae bacterium]|nr:FumA C-terminus/TtdB family hydratase beta subunit [Erysipelotrichaceae bacterium]
MKINLPEDVERLSELKAGDYVEISGFMYTARDAAHKRIKKLIEDKKELPFDLKNNGIYYVGPTPSGERVYGSAGPTTSSRMDVYTPELLDMGLKFMVGKGRRSKDVKEAIIRNKAVYFVAAGGAGALLGSCVKEVEDIAFEDLLSESVKKITVKDFPVFVGIDCDGNDIYER